MTTPRLFFSSFLLLLSLLSASVLSITTANAEPGISNRNIKIGMSIPLTGINANYGIEMKSTIEAYFDKINADGGIHGRTLTLVALDDGYEPQRVATNTKKLLQDHEVFALTSYYGTAGTTAALPVFTAAKVPLIGSVSGAPGLRIPNNHYLFHVRASYTEEAEAIVRQLLSVGLSNIGVFCQNDGFGKAGLEGITAALKKNHIEPSVIATIEPNSTDVEPAIQAFSKVRPQEIIMISLFKPSSALIHKLREAELYPYLSAFSSIDAVIFSKELGDAAHGIMVSEVMPYLWDDTLPLIHDYQNLSKKPELAGGLSYTGMEAYLNARVLIDAIRLAGRNLTREKLIETLENMHSHNIGGYPVSYSASNHSGSKFVEITVLGLNGKIVH